MRPLDVRATGVPRRNELRLAPTPLGGLALALKLGVTLHARLRVWGYVFPFIPGPPRVAHWTLEWKV